MKRYLFALMGLLFLVFSFIQVASPQEEAKFRVVKGSTCGREFQFKVVKHEQFIKGMDRRIIENLPLVQQHPIKWEIWVYPSIKDAEETLAEFLDSCNVAFQKLEKPEIGDNCWISSWGGIFFTYMNSIV